MGHSTSSSQALLDLENKAQNSSTESALLVCKKGDNELLKKLEAAKTRANALPNTKPTIAAAPPCKVMGKLGEFLEVTAESNKKLQQDAMAAKICSFIA